VTRLFGFNDPPVIVPWPEGANPQTRRISLVSLCDWFHCSALVGSRPGVTFLVVDADHQGSWQAFSARYRGEQVVLTILCDPRSHWSLRAIMLG